MRTLKEVYKYRKLVKETYLPAIENILRDIDEQLVEKGCVFPRPLSANIYWFIVAFLDLIFGDRYNSSDLNKINIYDLKFTSLYQSKTYNLNFIKPNKLLKLCNFAERKTKIVRKSFLVIQDGYEVRELRRHMKDYRFLLPSFYPKKGIIEEENISILLYDSKIGCIRSDAELLKRFIYSYVRNIVPKLNYLYFYYENQIKR